jgi:hypothetical protein
VGVDLRWTGDDGRFKPGSFNVPARSVVQCGIFHLRANSPVARWSTARQRDDLDVGDVLDRMCCVPKGAFPAIEIFIS